MKINLEFDSLAELDEFVAHHVKNKALQTTAAVAPRSEPSAPKDEAPKAETPKEPKAPKEPKEPKAPKEPEAKSAKDEISYVNDVAPRVLKLAEGKGRDAAVALLESFGVSKAPQLEPGQYAKFIAAVDAKLEED